MPKTLCKSVMLAAGVSLILSGCNTIDANQDLTRSVPQTFEYVSYKMDGTDQENLVKITVEQARMAKSSKGSRHPLELHFIGRFYHNNPAIRTDSPFRAKASIYLTHHGEGIVSIEDPELLDLELLSVHTPVRSLVHREAKDAFRKTVQSLNGHYLPEQKMLKLNSNLESLFSGSQE